MPLTGLFLGWIADDEEKPDLMLSTSGVDSRIVSGFGTGRLDFQRLVMDEVEVEGQSDYNAGNEAMRL